ncbi:cyclin-C1-2-like isoform X1 [Salvia hispanica]|uniref:cyclin-C1-2-like isoform X1 n=1 Tax=Salvia hispanica TaxID=49212 RepID=UPI0020095323|nr:cyclin-C1-2-like isoform X1 [Salvia hispanica]
MDANFWTSSHYKQLIDAEEVNVVHQLDKERGITAEDCKLIKFHTSRCIVELADGVKLQQRVAATAITYMRRLYTRKSMTEYNPCLVAATCLYLAAKSEETAVHAKLVAFQITEDPSKHIPMKISQVMFFVLSDNGLEQAFAGEVKYYSKEIHKMEMKILEALNYYLLVFHPYRSMTQFLQDAGVSNLAEQTTGIINDTYKMDLVLVHPPHLIALACIFIASFQNDKKITAWFEELRVDMNVVRSIAMEIIDFYESYKVMSEKPRTRAVMDKLR